MLLNTSAGNLNPTFIGQEYILANGDTISNMMKKVYNIPDSRASEQAGYYRAFFELNKLGGYIPSGRNENVINAGEKIKFFSLARIETRRNLPATQAAIVSYTPNTTTVETPIAPETTQTQEMGISKSKLFFVGGTILGVSWIVYEALSGKKKGKKK